VLSLFNLVDTVLMLFMYIVLIHVVMSWLTAFGVVNNYNRFVVLVNDFSYRLTEPVLRPIRRVLPSLNGIDFSPVVLLLLVVFCRNLIREYGF
jgi:YggT family protein